MSGQDGKPFAIPKELVWQAWKQVKANGGAAGADGVTIEMYEKDLKDNLYKVWNRMSSGTYFPPPVRAVEIPKSWGGTRVLGVPAVGDRVAQTVAAMALEPRTEAIFHDDSYGYRPRKGALDAVAACRQRCWARNWVIDLDVRKFFDSVPWDLMVKAVQANVTHEQRWIVLYVRRWLAAPIVMPDGRTAERDRGTPQGSAVSPVIANLFMHYAFDKWLEREFRPWNSNVTPTTPWCTARRSGRPGRCLPPGRENGRSRAGTPPGQDQDRVLQGQEPAALGLREHVVHLPRLHVPRQESPDRGQDEHVQRVPARGQQGRLKKMNEEVRAWRVHLRTPRNWTSSPRGSTPSSEGG